MDRTAQIGTGQNSNRTVALLFALADLALRAAGASHPVRWLVLWALRRAERIALAYVADRAVGPLGRVWALCVAPRRSGSDPGAAIDLARSLRALALAVRATDGQPGGRPLLPSGGPTGGGQRAAWIRGRIAALCVALLPVPPRDTS